MAAYYNEIDPYAAQWLRNLISAGHIAPGDVDERSITEVTADDIRHYTQCHFFAGIGVWSYALRRAGWTDDTPVWTGSCPCQPFSTAGAGKGFDDDRHLWPVFGDLIRECRPAVVFGEQVASKDANAWIDLVQADVEAMDYAFGCVAFPSAGVGAPHIRDRAYWVGDTEGERCREARNARSGHQERITNAGTTNQRNATNSFWKNSDWIYCLDDRWRPVEPGTFPLVNGTANRVGRLRAYGNAINAEAAKEFITAFMEFM